MPEKHFNDLDTISLFIAFAAGLWGSILSFIKRNKDSYTKTRMIIAFLFDMFTNIGFTLLTYIGLIGYGTNDLLAVAVASFVGHQGTRAIYLAELAIADKIGSKAMMDEVKKDKE